MKRYLIVATIPLLLWSLALPAMPGHRRKTISSTREFLIDGKRYLLDRSAGDDIPPLRREASRLGFDAPLAEIPYLSKPYFEDTLREVDGTTSSIPHPFPKGLLPDHVMKLVSEAGPVDLAVGLIGAGGRAVRNRLPATGWKCIELPRAQEPVTVATLNQGKEAFIVFLDEKTGKFLLVRKTQ